MQISWILHWITKSLRIIAKHVDYKNNDECDDDDGAAVISRLTIEVCGESKKECTRQRKSEWRIEGGREREEQIPSFGLNVVSRLVQQFLCWKAYCATLESTCCMHLYNVRTQVINQSLYPMTRRTFFQRVCSQPRILAYPYSLTYLLIIHQAPDIHNRIIVIHQQLTIGNRLLETPPIITND